MPFDYVFPESIAKVLRTPSTRTQMEASIIGILTMMLVSLFSSVYAFVSFTNTYLKIFTAIGEVGILLFLYSNLLTTYQQYYFYKLSMGMYKEKRIEEDKTGDIK